MVSYITPIPFVFFGTVIYLFSHYEKDYQNCVKLHGKDFCDKRKKTLKVIGPILFFLGSLWLILEFTGIF